MARRLLPVITIFTALLCDAHGSHAAALSLLLFAIPAAFVLLLDCYGDAVDGRCSGLRPAFAALALVLVVLSAALRSPAVVGGLPRFAVSALVLSLLLYGAVAVGAVLVPRRTAVVPLRIDDAPLRGRRAA